MSKYCLVPELLEACNEIAKRGYRIELEEMGGSYHHSITKVIICMNAGPNGEFTKRVYVTFTRGYKKNSIEFVGTCEEFGSVRFHSYPTIAPFLNAIKEPIIYVPTSDEK